MNQRRGGKELAERIDRFLFADLLVAVILGVLAFGTVEPWSLLIFQLNALLGGLMLAARYALSPEVSQWRLAFSLPLWLLLGVALLQLAPLDVVRLLPSAVAGVDGAAPPESLSPELLRAPTITRDGQATREAAMKLLSLAIYLMTGLHVLSATRRRRLAIRILAGFGLAISLLAIAQRLTWNGRIYWLRAVSPNVAPYGPYANYNHFAGLVEMLFPLALARMLFSRCAVEERLFLGLATTLMIAAGIFSLSRGGMLATGAQIVLFGLLSAISRRRGTASSLPAHNPLLPALILAGALVIAIQVGYEPLLQRFGTVRQGADERSLTTRIEYWKASWRMFLDHPVAGVGLGAFPTIYPRYGTSSARHERLEQAHNDYLQLLTDAGILGGGIGVLAIGLLLREVWRRWRHWESLQADERAVFIGAAVAIAGLLIHSLVDFNLQIAANALLFSFIVSLVVSPAEEQKKAIT